MSTFQEMWDTRPPRIPKKQGGNAMVAGICEGIAVRYQIDATLVRIAFVALSLIFGVGLFVYTLCGFLMPRFGMDTSPAQAVSRPKDQLDRAQLDDRSTGWGLLILLILFFPSVSVSFGGDLAASALGGLALAGLAWWGLHQRMPVPPEGVVVQPASTPSASDSPAPDQPVTANFTAPDGYTHPAAGTAGTTPPSWDPLGTAPSLWHLPDPGPAQPEPGPAPKTNRPLWIWIPVALVLTASTFLTMSVGSQIRNGSLLFGDNEVKISLPDQIPEVRGGVGDLTVDLTDLKPLDEPAYLDISNRVGSVEVIMPKEKVAAEVTCTSNLGETTCPPEPVEGEGELLTIDVSQNIGRIQVVWSE